MLLLNALIFESHRVGRRIFIDYSKILTYDTFYLPFAQALLRSINTKYIAIVFDGRAVGHGCIALVAGLAYRNRSLPICWLVKKGGKGHMEEKLHIERWQRLLAIVPANKKNHFSWRW